MTKFHYEILSPEQKNLLPLIKKLKNRFFLGGGTAIALWLGHRKSIDFDLFCNGCESLPLNYILKQEKGLSKKVIINTSEQRDVIINGVKISYIAYFFKLETSFFEDNYIKIPDLLTLAAMKAYAIGRRAKWKDYVDLYFLIKKFGIEKIIDEAKKIFGGDFSSKLFIRQLGYFEDIDMSERVEFMKGFEIDENEMKKYLLNISQQAIF